MGGMRERKTECVIRLCEREPKARGYCNAHYRQVQKGAPVGQMAPLPPKAACSMEDCVRESRTKGLCVTHYKRLLNHGDPKMVLRYGPAPHPLEALLARRVRPFGASCLIAGPNPKNYVQIVRVGVGRENVSAHRLAWELAYGAIPDGLLVLHHCDTPACVKTDSDENYPDGHLFVGTQSDNIRDMYAKGRR